jgi:hypothetical protein
MLNKNFPLDYFMELPQELKNDKLTEDEQTKAYYLENTFKNVVMRRL